MIRSLFVLGNGFGCCPFLGSTRLDMSTEWLGHPFLNQGIWFSLNLIPSCPGIQVRLTLLCIIRSKTRGTINVTMIDAECSYIDITENIDQTPFVICRLPFSIVVCLSRIILILSISPLFTFA